MTFRTIFNLKTGEEQQVPLTPEEIADLELNQTPEPVPAEISDRQFFQELAHRELITEAEAEDAVASGVIPASLLALVEGLPPEQRFPARMFLKGATRFERGHPMTEAIGFAYGMTAEEIDELWRSAAIL